MGSSLRLMDIFRDLLQVVMLRLARTTNFTKCRLRRIWQFEVFSVYSLVVAVCLAGFNQSVNETIDFWRLRIPDAVCQWSGVRVIHVFHVWSYTSNTCVLVFLCSSCLKACFVFCGRQIEFRLFHSLLALCWAMFFSACRIFCIGKWLCGAYHRA